MGPTDRFSPDEVQRILGLTGKQLDYWDRLRLVSPRRDKGIRSYDFRDLIGLRTVKQLAEKGVPANRLQRALAALREKLSQVHTPLAELRVLSDGKNVVVESGGARLKPLSGQFVLNFEIRELDERVRVMSGRSADDWLAAALEFESNGKKAEAIDAYERALIVDPEQADALINCGTLHYESGNLERASECFGRALALDEENALAHFNLGSVLEEIGEMEEARRHLRQAVRLDPNYSDAHYNLAFVCEKLSAFDEAREHWQAYIKLEPTGPWCGYARQRLASSQSAKSAGSL
ncbi:MAG TPA: tetratricopeptide repeat protein [Candidatus Acidoferrum sp.]|jgi:tetratricopeptide (TPR) repeat protein